MRTGTTVAWSVGVVAVIAAVGVGAVMVATSVTSGAAPSGAVESTPSPTPSPTAPLDEEAAMMAELGDGYQYLGHGTSIPKNAIAGCPEAGYIFLGSDDDGPPHAEHLGADLVDLGPRDYAQGTVGFDDQGRIATYTVAPGDVETVIGERFCIYNGIALGMLNGYPGGDAIQPGDVITLNADLVTDWVSPYPEG
ncbi:hypothetical protein [Microbacterium hydrocarbonoxydans]|uniref:hypothetical protein n=1 Tax=Microbacterium hydrocarbonoxydans TaxID=273678 RepID=UPI00203C6E27|nr:hypothetical protein [Microbacterium hydrocarbonoxydans]MCM3781134.1 hypothetical protein [Microbacterium hydrocarbonoxydans]